MSREELRTKLATLEEIRQTAERELEAIRERKERLEALEQDKDALLASYANSVPEALEQLSPEERHRVYRMLRLRVSVGSEGLFNVSGAFRCDPFVCESEPASSPRTSGARPRDLPRRWYR